MRSGLSAVFALLALSCPLRAQRPTVYFNSSFENGSLSPFAKWLGNGKGAITVATEQAHTGTHSVKLVTPTTEWQTALVFYYPNPNPTRYKADANGLYQSWWFWMDQTSINNIVNTTPGKGQLKFNSNRTNDSNGKICPGSWITDGWSHGENSPNWGTWDTCGGLNVVETNIPIKANKWHHVQTFFLYNDTANSVSVTIGGGVGKRTIPVSQGVAILWYDETKVYDQTAKHFGAPCTPTSEAIIDGTRYTCAAPNATYYPNEQLTGFFGNYVVEDPQGTITMYLDDLEAADQYIPAFSARAVVLPTRSLAFAGHVVGTTSAAQNVTLPNSGRAP
jgi:hypothetical protein